MKLLFDENFSPRLVDALCADFPGSTHVHAIGYDGASDSDVWSHARNGNFIIVTKDVDFSDRSTLFGHPPKVIWIRMGNCTTYRIEAALRAQTEQIEAFSRDAELGVLAICG